MPIMDAVPDLLETVRAGMRYSDALKRFQDVGITGLIDGTDELERLFIDWHDKAHAVMDRIEGRESS